MKKYMRRITICLCICTASLLLIACTPKQEGFASDGKPSFQDSTHTYIPPPVQLAQFSSDPKYVLENSGRNGFIDVEGMPKGYVIMAVIADVRARAQISVGTKGTDDYQSAIYEMNPAGKHEVIPLNFGSGHYTVTIFLSTGNPSNPNEYTSFLVAQEDVTLENELAPFLVNNQTVDFSEDSSCVAKSYDVSIHASSKLEVIQQVYYWVYTNISYDNEVASAILEAGGRGVYIPDLEQIMLKQQGICFDYASLTAAMLRANGIPAQVVKGNVTREDGSTILHAWNNIWLEDVGWISIGIPTTPEEWKRIDTTFAASKDPDISKFIGNGENYFPLGLM